MKLDRADFEKLALEQLDAVDRFARNLCRNSTESEDLVQETYLRAFRAADSFQLQSFGIRPWLFRILNNVHTTRATRENKQPRAIDIAHLQSFESGNGDGDAVSEPLTLSGSDSQISQALDELPVELATTISLWALDDLTYKEIAEVMNVPIGTVMSRLHRARQKLTQRLQGIADRTHQSTE